MKRFKRFIAGFVAGALIFSSIPVFAADQLKLIIDGVDVTEANKINLETIDESTASLLKVIAEAFRATFEFDEASNSITITPPAPPVVPNGVIGSRTNPIPKETTVIFDSMSRSFGSAYKVELTLLEIIRGDEAWDIVKESNRFNDEPGEGEEYMLAKFRVKALESKDDEKISLSQYDFDFVSAKGVMYDGWSTASGLKPEFTGIYVGGEIEGMVSRIIKVGDIPSIVFCESFNKGLWFSIDENFISVNNSTNDSQKTSPRLSIAPIDFVENDKVVSTQGVREPSYTNSVSAFVKSGELYDLVKSIHTNSLIIESVRTETGEKRLYINILTMQEKAIDNARLFASKAFAILDKINDTFDDLEYDKIQMNLLVDEYADSTHLFFTFTKKSNEYVFDEVADAKVIDLLNDDTYAEAILKMLSELKVITP